MFFKAWVHHKYFMAHQAPSLVHDETSVITGSPISFHFILNALVLSISKSVHTKKTPIYTNISESKRKRVEQLINSIDKPHIGHVQMIVSHEYAGYLKQHFSLGSELHYCKSRWSVSFTTIVIGQKAQSPLCLM